MAHWQVVRTEQRENLPNLRHTSPCEQWSASMTDGLAVGAGMFTAVCEFRRCLQRNAPLNLPHWWTMPFVMFSTLSTEAIGLGWQVLDAFDIQVISRYQRDYPVYSCFFLAKWYAGTSP